MTSPSALGFPEPIDDSSIPDGSVLQEGFDMQEGFDTREDIQGPSSLMEEASLPETWIPTEELMGYQEQILAELQVTNVFLFHIEVLLFLVLGGFVFSLMYKAIKHNVTNHFT